MIQVLKYFALSTKEPGEVISDESLIVLKENTD